MLVKIKGLLYSAHIGTALLTAMIITYPLMRCHVDMVFIFLSAIAVITSTMIGFLVNDIVDIERDRINKPYRPHVNNVIAKDQVLLFCIMLTIIFIYTMVKLTSYTSTSVYILIYFVFYLLYNFVNKISGLLKNLTISIGFVFPYLFITVFLGILNNNFFLILFTFFFFLYRELLMDINDKEGDLKTGLMTIPTRISDSAARFMVAIYWLLTVIFMLLHTFSFSFDYMHVNICFIIIIILSIQNLIWNNLVFSKFKMRFLLISMWIPMSLSVLLIKGY